MMDTDLRLAEFSGRARGLLDLRRLAPELRDHTEREITKLLEDLSEVYLREESQAL